MNGKSYTIWFVIIAIILVAILYGMLKNYNSPNNYANVNSQYQKQNQVQTGQNLPALRFYPSAVIIPGQTRIDDGRSRTYYHTYTERLSPQWYYYRYPTTYYYETYQTPVWIGE